MPPLQAEAQVRILRRSLINRTLFASRASQISQKVTMRSRPATPGRRELISLHLRLVCGLGHRADNDPASQIRPFPGSHDHWRRGLFRGAYFALLGGQSRSANRQSLTLAAAMQADIDLCADCCRDRAGLKTRPPLQSALSLSWLGLTLRPAGRVFARRGGDRLYDVAARDVAKCGQPCRARPLP
jgi:hypothetical protein